MVLKTQSVERCSDPYCENGYKKRSLPLRAGSFYGVPNTIEVFGTILWGVEKFPETICFIRLRALQLQSA